MFVNNPNDNKYLAASWQSSNPQISVVSQAGANLELVVNFIRHSGPVTLLVFFSALFIYATYLLNIDILYQKLSFFSVFDLSHIDQIWRLFTPALLHFSTLHVVFNLLMWWYLGGLVENKLSSKKLLMIFILASSLPNIIQYYISGPAFGGLSGVVYALVGYFWWRNPKIGLYLPPAYIGFMLVWLVMGFFDILGFKIANGAHVGGLLVGCALAWFDNIKK